MVEYRRRIKGNKKHKWHWCTNCHDWPKSGEFETRYRMPNENLCDRCLGFVNDKKCDKHGRK